MTIKTKYNQNGFVLIKKLFDKNFCADIKHEIKKLNAKLTIPFSDVPFGFGDVRDKEPFNKISNSVNLKKLSDELIGNISNLSHFMLVNKAAWIGPDVEWHQEVFNLQIYAPGCNPENDWHKFLQVFIAIDDHNKLNGCLKAFKGSHKAGILEFEDIVNVNCSHKRRVTTNALNNLHKTYEIVDLEMEAGDALFFNHLLVHGSPSNLSPYSRLSALLQYYDSSLNFEGKNFSEYSNFRAKFVENWLSSSLEKIDDYKDKLTDFKKN